MNNNNFEFTFVTDRQPTEVFRAINNIKAWWNAEMKGDSTHLNDEFSVKFWDVHYSKQKVVEFVPDKKVVWLVTESQLTFIKERDEWTGTRIRFELDRKGEQTRVRFVHEGLAPKVECYKDCSKAWSEFLADSLLRYITTGKGQPYTESSEVNA